jgi:hypothetical protein
MRTFTLRLQLLLAFLVLSAQLNAQEVFQTVGLIGTATPQGWEASTPLKLATTADPHQWTATLYLTAGEAKFRANNSWDVNWGASDYPSGTAYRNGPNIPIPESRYYTLWFNDQSGAYHFEALSPTEYSTVGLIGDATSGSWNVSTPMEKGADGHSWTLESITLSGNELKFRANDSWEVNWGGNSFPAGTAQLNGSNIAAQAGTYAVRFNDVTGEYLFENLNPTVYETVGLIGTATPGGWQASTPMQLANPADPHSWTLTLYLTADELKFRANDSWEVNWGGTAFPAGTAYLNGDNLQIPTASYYSIQFNSLTGAYSLTQLFPTSYASVGLVGSATPGGWEASTPMVKGPDGHSWTLENITLTEGAAKFRANNSWDVNWGGTDFPSGTASQNGDDIPIPAGTYTVHFNDVTLAYGFEPGEGGSTDGIVTLSPALPTADEPLTITYDASKGVSGLQGASKVYMHSGVVLSGPEGTNWTNVVGNWGQDDGLGEMTPVAGEPDKWQITLPSVREYYGVEGVPVFRLGMVFRNASGTQTGKSETDGDIYVNLNPGDYVRFTQPAEDAVFGVSGDVLQLSATASSQAGELRLELNEGSGYQQVAAVSNSESISYAYTIGTATSLQLRVTATMGDKTVVAERTLTINLRQATPIAALPAGLKRGINYHPSDPGKATLVLLAPGKQFAHVVGDFTNWDVQDAYQMNQTPDGEYFWLELEGLQPQREYVYQYWVDGTIKIGDPYADKVADPYHDGSLPAHVYPNPLGYTNTQHGIATVLQTVQEAYAWKFPEVAGGRPANEELVIYELLLRDFLGSHSYRDLADTLSYLKRLGVNAIELLPIMEFEGNESWGYNPTYLFAPDKYYGSKNDLKAFIDKAHEEGFVVLLDMVLNHQFGQSPMVRLYWDAANNRPAANSPWFNPEATHPFNVGYDMNHESPYTKQYIDDVNRYWIEEFKFDGYRFDLSKGFTQRNNPNDVGAWSAYDQSRIDILKRMADVIWATDPGAYVILEHLGANDEEKVLADYGMMLWGNLNHPYSEVVNGRTGTNLDWSLAASRGWNDPHLISYMESHDEERLMVRALNEGGKSGDYDIQQLDIALERIKLASAFYYPLPGPKMIWQFGELGYDFPINFNGRTGNKPLPWGDRDGLNYHRDEDRIKLYKAKAAIITLVNDYSQVFEAGDFSWTPSGQLRKINISHEEMNVTIVGNFGLSEGVIVPDFQHSGTWYDFFSGEAFEVSSTGAGISLAPGEFHIYLDKPVAFPEPGLVKTFSPIVRVQPGTFTIDDQIKITFDAAVADPDGTAGLVGAEKVYLRAGLVTDGPQSTTLTGYVGSANQDDGIGLMSKVPGDNELWTLVLRPRDYFSIAAGEGAYRIGMYFRSANGQQLGKGEGGQLIFVDIQQKQEIVSVAPSPFTADEEIILTFDAAQADPAGTAGLANASKVYMHSGVVTAATDAPSGSDWTYVVGNWGQDDGLGQMRKVPGDNALWEISLRPREYYGLEAGTPVYYLAMVFRNADGTAEGKGPGGTDLFIRVAQGAPAAPANLQARLKEELFVELSWEKVSLAELGFVLERKSEYQQEFERLALLDEHATSFTDWQTVDGVSYAYRIKALGAYTPDSDYSSIASIHVPLLAPSALAAVVESQRTVVLSWQDRSQNETGYRVERAVQKGKSTSAYALIGELPANASSFTDSEPVPGVLNYYRVFAIDADEQSAYSGVVSIQTVERGKPGKKEALTASLSLYPNPAAGQLTISSDMALEAPIYLRITSMQGVVQKSATISPQTPAGRVEVSVRDLPAGLYLVQALYQDISTTLLLEIRH